MAVSSKCDGAGCVTVEAMSPVKVPTHPIDSYSSGTVTSKDGTVIGYRSIGRGPGLLIVQGGMGTIHNYNRPSISLADDFTVFIADRRGRGASALAYTPEAAAIERHVEDVDALRQASGAEFLFGLSSGAIIALEATRALSGIEKTVLYEPPFYPDRDVPREDIARFYREIADDDLPAAMATVIDIVKLAPWFVSILPRPLQEMGTSRMLREQDRSGDGPYASFRELLPTMRFDFQIVAERGDAIASYQGGQVPILLLGGSSSPPYLKSALDALEKMLPHARRNVLRGLGHSGPWNRDRRGAPQVVAEQMRSFLRAGNARSESFPG